MKHNYSFKSYLIILSSLLLGTGVIFAQNESYLWTKGSHFTKTTTGQQNMTAGGWMSYYAVYSGRNIDFKVTSSFKSRPQIYTKSSEMLLFNPEVFPGSSFIVGSNMIPKAGSMGTESSVRIVYNDAGTFNGNPSAQRGNLAGQICLKSAFRTIAETSTSKVNRAYFITLPINLTTQDYTMSDFDNVVLSAQSIIVGCDNYYVAYCGDKVIDKRAGTFTQDGDGGIMIQGAFKKWTFAPMVSEVCDDGVDNGKPGKCKTDCTGIGNGNDSCTLTTPATIEAGTTGNLAWTLPAGVTSSQLTSTPTVTGLPSSLSTTGGTVPFSPLQGGTHTFTLNFTTTNGTTGSCSATSAVTNTNPTCVLTGTISIGTKEMRLMCTAENATLYNMTVGNTSIGSGRFDLASLIGNTVSASTLINLALYNGVQTANCTVSTASGKTGSCSFGFGEAPNLSIVKTLSEDKLYGLGDTVGYKIVIKNNGTSTVNGARLEDVLPNGVDYVSSQLIGITPPYSFGTGYAGGVISVAYTGLTLTPGQSATLYLTGLVKNTPDAFQNAINIAYLYPNPTDTTTNLFSSVIFTFKDNVQVTKTVDKTTAFLGDNVFFTISVKNNGPTTITGVQIQDLWPNGFGSCLTYDNKRTANTTTANGTQDGTVSTWTFSDPLPVGQTRSISLTGQIATTASCVGTYTNTGRTNFYLYGKPVSKDTTANFTVVPRAREHVSINKKIISGGIQRGQTITFEISYVNDGNLASSFDINDTWPSTLDFIGATPAPGSVAGNQLRRTVMNLAPNQGGTIQVQGRIR